MTKEQFWQTVYIEAMRQSKMKDPKEWANQAVAAFENMQAVIAFEKMLEQEDQSEPFTQAGRFKRLLEELGVEIFCSNDEDNSSILICGTELKFYFTNGEFDNFEK